MLSSQRVLHREPAIVAANHVRVVPAVEAFRCSFSLLFFFVSDGRLLREEREENEEEERLEPTTHLLFSPNVLWGNFKGKN